MDDPSIEFLAIETDGKLTAGAILNDGPNDALGVSNLFGCDAAVSNILAAIVVAHRHRLIAAYDMSEKFRLYDTRGFVPVGDLLVWVASS